MRTLLALAICLIASTCFGQVEYNKEYKPFEPIVIKLDHEAPADSKTTVLWSANFTYIEGVNVLYGWAAPGDYEFTGTVFNTKKIKLGEETYDVLVGLPTQIRGEFKVTGTSPPNPGPGPGPTPVPGPDPVPVSCDQVPTDPYDNIGRKVCQWSTGLPKRAEVGAVFEKWAGRLMKDPALTVNSASSAMVAERDSVLGLDAPKYADLFQNKLQFDLSSRWPLSKGSLAAYYMAIAAGFKNAN